MSPPRVLALAATAFVAVLVLVASYLVASTPDDVLKEPPAPATPEDAATRTVEVTVPEGASAGAVAATLAEREVIRSARQFEVLISLMGMQDKLSPGEYTLRVGSSVPAVIDAITVKESVPVIRVTFPEGIRVEEMAEIAEAAGFGTAGEFLAALETAEVPPGLAESMPPAGSLPPGQRLQGYLFPDTYIRPVGTSAAELVELMLETMAERFSPELRAAAAEQGLTPHQALTLASIVEREAVLAEERALIAGVFFNRLEANDTLGADPTVQFAVALDPASVEEHGWWKPELTIDDLENQSPYNTRLFPGLPPGPIANPGLASIEAVAHPEETDYYYFVADARAGDGSHVFAETLAEHERNIAEYGAP